MGKTEKGLLRIILFAFALAGLFAAFQFLPVAEYLEEFLGLIQRIGFWGPVILVLMYILATVLMAPGVILTLVAGFSFGLLWGTIAVMAGSVIGSLCAFLVGRTIGREFVEQKAKENPKFAAIDRAVEQHGFKIVLLTRLSPIFPFNLLNYLFSITKVRTRDYFLASWIGMFPGTILYVYLGTAAKSLTEIASGEIEGGVQQKIVLAIGLIATILVTVSVTRIARQALREYVEPQ